LLSRKHRVIPVSLRHFFPEQWNGRGGKFTISQHGVDGIAFIEALQREGHIAFRVAQERSELLRKLILAEQGGELDASFAEPAGLDVSSDRRRVPVAAAKIASGEIDGGLKSFVESINGQGTRPLYKSCKMTHTPCSGRLRINASPTGERRQRPSRCQHSSPWARRHRGSLRVVLRALAAAVRGSKTSNHRQCSASYDPAEASRH
jgi:hypothetical protein